MPPDPTTDFAELDAGLPVVMLPVRLETRYFAIDADHVELRLRIFPSRLHVTVDRPGIDPVERDQMMAYWRIRQTAGAGTPAERTAWQRVVELFGEPRGVFLRRTLTPTVGTDGSLSFPAVAVAEPDDDAVLAAVARGLPGRFIVAGYAGDQQVFRVAGADVPTDIAVGPVGDGAAIGWQTDFAAAEAIGLGIRQPLATAAASTMTRLVVFGAARPGPGPTSAADPLGTLLTAHLERDGVALAAAGTPTNNTPSCRAPTMPASSGQPAEPGSERQRLATALGVQPEVFANVAGGDEVAEPATAAMHAVLWHATFQYFFDHMQPDFPDLALVERAKALFAGSVRPAGPWPTIVVGNQPYGVLPVGSLARRVPAGASPDPLADTLRAMLPAWRTAASSVPRLGPAGDIGEQLSAILSQAPASVRWLTRHARSIFLGPVIAATLDPQVLARAPMLARRRDEDGLPDPLPVDPVEPDGEDPGQPPPPHPGHRVVFADEVAQLTVPVAAPPDADRSAPLPVDYLAALAAADEQAVRDGTFAGATPPTLLSMLARRATQLVFGYLTGTGIVPMPDGAARAAHSAALAALAGQPVGVLERLTVGAVDAASHRIDAWVTALAAERLAAMRAIRPTGYHLGAYAWVDAPPLPPQIPTDADPPTVDPENEGYLLAPGLDHARTAAVLRGGFLARLREGAEAPLAVDLSAARVGDALGLLDGVRNGASLAALLGERIERWMVDAGLGPQLPAVRERFDLVDGSGRRRIDGLRAAEAWVADPPTDLGQIPARLAAAIDAIGDLLLAEAVHHQSAGNPTRAQPALTALDSGVTMPSTLDVVTTRPDATVTTWRVVLPVAPEAIEAWADGVLGDVAGLGATVASTTGPSTIVTLAEAGVTAAMLRRADRRGVLNLLAQHAGGTTAEPSVDLSEALDAAAAVQRVLRAARPMTPSDDGGGRAPVPALSARSAQVEWLHDLGRVRPVVGALGALELRERAAGRTLDLQAVATGPDVVTVAIGGLPSSPSAGVVLDGWNESTPGTSTTAGVAVHYDAPRSRPPQAILLVTPSDATAGWSVDDVEAALVETADLAAVRMVRPGGASGALLPATYLADDTADQVATQLSGVAVVVTMAGG